MRRAAIVLFGLAVSTLAATTGCTTYADALARGERAYDANDHERALAIFRTLEHDMGHFSQPERARYYYLRGMTDFRIGYRADARHWLVLAKAEEDRVPGTLVPDWKTRTETTLAEMNAVVYANGTAGLTNAPPAQ